MLCAMTGHVRGMNRRDIFSDGTDGLSPPSLTHPNKAMQGQRTTTVPARRRAPVPPDLIFSIFAMASRRMTVHHGMVMATTTMTAAAVEAISPPTRVAASAANLPHLAPTAAPAAPTRRGNDGASLHSGGSYCEGFVGGGDEDGEAGAAVGGDAMPSMTAPCVFDNTSPLAPLGQ